LDVVLCLQNVHFCLKVIKTVVDLSEIVWVLAQSASGQETGKKQNRPHGYSSVDV
jgi:hypothetical protein